MNETDHDIIIKIHSLLTNHVKRFEEHVALDDRRETEYRLEVKDTAQKLMEISGLQTQVLWVFGIALTVLQTLFRFWK